MKPFKIKPLLLAISLSAISHLSYAQINTDRAVIKNDGSEQLNLNANFATAITGDLYIAIQVGNELLFIANNGREFSYEVSPYAENKEYSGSIPILDMSAAAGIPAGYYSVYQVVAQSNTDPLNFTNWVGGLAGLNIINLNIGLNDEVSGDFDGDGFADDDLNRDGFHDDDSNKDGYHDDKDYDGYHDDDRNGIDDDSDSGDDNKDSDSSNTSKDKKARELYEDNCSQCHGKDPSKDRDDILGAAKAKETHSAIKKNKGGMGFLKFLSDDEVQDIADYVKTFK